MSKVRTRIEDSIHIDAPPHEVYAYCMDPAKLFADDPKTVVDSFVEPAGIGTTARLEYRSGDMVEDDRLWYSDVVPDSRIDISMQPNLSIHGARSPLHESALYTLTHTFEADGGGTRMTIAVKVHDEPVFERIADRFHDHGPERLVHDRLSRIREAVEQSLATA